jgi:hypothetical protein
MDAIEDIYALNENLTEIQFNKPNLGTDSVYYGSQRPTLGHGGIEPVPSLLSVSALLDDMLAAITKSNPDQLKPPYDLAERVDSAKHWIAYAGPGGQFQEKFLQAIQTIMSKAF